MSTQSAATRIFATLLACAFFGSALFSSAWADDYDVEFNGKWFNVTGTDNFVGKMRISGEINATAHPPVGTITVTVAQGKSNSVFAEVKSNKIVRVLLIDTAGYVTLDVLADYKIPSTGERGESVLYLKLPYTGNPPKSLTTGNDQRQMAMNTSTGLLTFDATAPGIRIGTVSKRPPPRR
jgi:hypothetical protein